MKLKIAASMTGLDEYSRSVTILASTPNPAGDQAGIKTWDLSRFEKNPAILWMHNKELLPIGTASCIEVSKEGLKMRVTFASAEANPLAEQVWQCTREKIVRACSVGYEWIDEAKGSALLDEVSMVTIGLDEDAGTEDLNPDAVLSDEEKMRERVSGAAREMAQARARHMKRIKEETEAKAKAEPKLDSVQRYDVGGRLDRAKRTSIGGAYINARISRVGVLRYVLPDGSIRRELRHPNEVFKADSLATLNDVPVIDISHHTSMLSTEDYKRATVGHLKSYRHDGRFIESELVVQDADTLERIDAGERTEISCGYTCTLDMTPGEWNGERFDCSQVGITYNHVALCPPNRGRAGPEVGLRLDTRPDARWGVTNIQEQEKTMKVIRIDGTEYEVGSDTHLAKLDSVHKTEVEKAKLAAQAEAKVKLDAADAIVATANKARDEAQAKFDQLEVTVKQERTDAAAAATKAKEAEAAKEEAAKKNARSRRRLERFFSRYFSGEDDMDEEETEEKKRGFDPKDLKDEEKDEKGKKKSKLDKLDSKLDAMSDRDIMIASIKVVDPHFDSTDRSDDYLLARFDAAVLDVQKTRSVDGVVRAANEGLSRLDADGEVTAIDKARKARDEKMANIWKGAPSADGGSR